MDDRAFEALTRRVGQARHRRGMLAAAAAGLSAPLLAGFGVQLAAAQDEVGAEAFGFCRVGGFPCSRDQQCCTGKCKAGLCGCAKRGKSCINRVGANCCSKRCRNGKCK